MHFQAIFTHSPTNVEVFRKMPLARRLTRKLFLEQLEDRSLLAGDVTEFQDLTLPLPPEEYRSANVSSDLSRVAYELDLYLASHSTRDFIPQDRRIKLSEGRVLVEAVTTGSATELAEHFRINLGADIVAAADPVVAAWVPLGTLHDLRTVSGLTFANAPISIAIHGLTGDPQGGVSSDASNVAEVPVGMFRESAGVFIPETVRPGGESDSPIPDGVTQIYWDAAQLILAGKESQLPQATVPRSDASMPGYMLDIVQYDDQFRLATDLHVLAITPELLTKLSALNFVQLNTYSPQHTGPVPGDGLTYSRIECWLHPSDLSEVLQLDEVMWVSSSTNVGYSGTAISGTAPIPEVAVGALENGPSNLLVALGQHLDKVDDREFAATAADSNEAITIQVADIHASVVLQIVNSAGQPVSSVNIGDEFQLQGILVLSAPEGVTPYAAYADIRFSTGLVTPVNGAGDVGLFESSLSSSLIDEVGRIMYDPSSNGSPSVFFSKTFTATKTGTVTFASDAADRYGHEIYVTGLDFALPLSQVTFQTVSLQIRPRNG